MEVCRFKHAKDVFSGVENIDIGTHTGTHCTHIGVFSGVTNTHHIPRRGS